MVLYSNPITQSILLCVISVIFVTGFSANCEFGMKHKDLSNFLIVVDLKPIRSTEPSARPSIDITSPFLNLFSTKTKIPEIRFLNKSWAPNAMATPNKPKPAIIGATLIPQSSNTAEKPRIININLIAAINHSIRSLDSTLFIPFNLKINGSITRLIFLKFV